MLLHPDDIYCVSKTRSLAHFNRTFGDFEDSAASGGISPYSVRIPNQTQNCLVVSYLSVGF